MKEYAQNTIDQFMCRRDKEDDQQIVATFPDYQEQVKSTSKIVIWLLRCGRRIRPYESNLIKTIKRVFPLTKEKCYLDPYLLQLQEII